MIVLLTLIVVGILGVTHYIAYSAGKNTTLSISKAKLKELVVLELKDEKTNNSKGKNTE